MSSDCWTGACGIACAEDAKASAKAIAVNRIIASLLLEGPENCIGEAQSARNKVAPSHPLCVPFVTGRIDDARLSLRKKERTLTS
jgi:hypothetical protein